MTMRSSIPAIHIINSALAAIAKCDSMYGIRARAVGKRFIRELPVRPSHDTSAASEVVGHRKGDSLANQRVGRGFAQLLSGSGAALLVGASLLLGGSQVAIAAGTLTFTYTDACDDDGENCESTITPSGTLTDLPIVFVTRNLSSETDGLEINDTSGVDVQFFRIYPSTANGTGNGRRITSIDKLSINGVTTDLPKITPAQLTYSGHKSLTGSDSFSYVNTDDFPEVATGYFRLDTDKAANASLEHHKDSRSGNNLSYGAADAVKFKGTLQSVLNDNDFNINIKFSWTSAKNADNTVIFKTATRPDAVEDFKATAGIGQVVLSWTAAPTVPSGSTKKTVTKYQLRYAEGNTIPDGTTWDTDITGRSSTGYTFTGLNSGKAHAFQIRAVSPNGNSDVSEMVTATPKFELPLIPTGFAANPGDGEVELEWADPNNSSITRYEFRYKEGTSIEGATWAPINNSDASTTSHTVKNLTNDTQYAFQVRAVNPTGTGLHAPVKTATPILPAPTEFVATEGNGKVTLSWKDPSIKTIKWYELRYVAGDSVPEAAEWAPIANSGAATITHPVESLVNNTEYAFEIRVVGAGGTSLASQTVTATPNIGPGQPQNFELTPARSAVKLTWKDPLPVPGGIAVGSWEYLARTGSFQSNDSIVWGEWGNEWTAVPASDITTTDGTHEYTHKGLGNNTPRQYRIRGLSAGGSPGPYAESSEHVTPHEEPQPPGAFAVGPNDGGVTLSWDKPSNLHKAIATTYEYQQSEGNQNNFGDKWQEIPGGKDAREYDVTGLTNETTYYFRIRARTAAHEGQVSKTESATPKVAPATPVLGDPVPGNGEVKLVWTYTPNNAEFGHWQYQLRVSGTTAWGNWEEMRGVTESGREYTVDSNSDPDLVNGTTYDFQIRASTTNGVGSEPSNFISATPAAPPEKPAGFKAEAGDQQVTLSWTGPKNDHIIRYEYQQKESSGNFGTTWEKMNLTGDVAAAREYVVTGLTNGTAYTFRMRAVTVGGEGTMSNDSTSVTPDKTPRTPSGFRLEPGNEEITLVWNDQSNDEASIVKWQLRQKESGATDWGAWTDIPVPADETAETMTSHTVETGLQNGKTYDFQIRAVATGDKFSDPSVLQSATPAGPPAKASDLKAEPGAKRVTLSWTLAADASIEKWQYQQQQEPDDGNWPAWPDADDMWTDMQGSNAATRNYTVRDLTGDIKHRFRIRAVGYGGNSDPSDAEEATPEPGPAAEEEKRVLKQTMAAVAQATLASAVDTIGHRFDAAPRANTLTLAGRTVGGAQDTPEVAMAAEDEETVFGTDPWADARLARDSMEPWNDAHLQAQRIDENSLLWNSGFTLALSENGSGGSGWTLWGRGDWLGFEGVDGTESWDGKQWTAWLGADTRMSERVMAGLAVSRGVVETDYTLDGEFEGTLETSLTAVWPYVQMTTGEGSAVRLVLGAGTGDAEHRGFDEEVEEASLSLIAGSVSGRFLMTRSGNASISAIGGASMAQIKTNGEAATSSIAGLKANSWRVRAGVEAAHDGYPMSSESGWMMAPRGSVSARQDGGDGVTGTGMEVSAGVQMTAPDGRISLDASGHWLAAHSKNGTKEWGASLEARMNAGADGRGLSLALGTDWGHQQQGGALTREKLFEDEQQTEPQGLSLTARSGYGFAMSGGLLTPFAEMAYGGDDARTRSFETGISFARGEFGASVTAGLRDSDDSASESRIGLELQLRY